MPLTSGWRQLIVGSFPSGSLVLQTGCFPRAFIQLALAVFVVRLSLLGQDGEEEEGQEKYSLKHLDLVCVRPATPADF